MAEKNEIIPITILTGFLGSGKTTILNQLLSSPELADTAVLINEFGEMGLDHLLVNSINDDIVLLEHGCVCCSVRDDFSSALLKLYYNREKQNIPAFRRVILETTGIANPMAVHQLIMTDKEITKRYRYNSTVTIVDAVHGEQTLDKHIEAVNQVSVADQLLISKTDLVDSVCVHNLEARLHKLNPLAAVVYAGINKLNANTLIYNSKNHLIDSFKTAPDKHKYRSMADTTGEFSAIYDHRFSTFCLSWTESVEWDDFVAWLEGLLIARGDSIHRLKGVVNIIGEKQPIVIQGVQHSFYPPEKLDKWPHNIPLTELVFITSDFTRQAAIKSFEDILNVTVK